MALNLEEWNSLDDIVKISKEKVRELINKHYQEIEHDEERKKFEIKEFINLFRFITRKWNVEILYELEMHKQLYFNELNRHLGKISTRTLSDSLKQLQDYDLIIRETQDTSPPSVIYRLSEKGKGFIEMSLLLIFFLAK